MSSNKRTSDEGEERSDQKNLRTALTLAVFPPNSVLTLPKAKPPQVIYVVRV